MIRQTLPTPLLSRFTWHQTNPLHCLNILRAEYRNRHGLEARYRKYQHLNPQRVCKSVIDLCDIPTKATSITKKYGLPRDITKSQPEHLFGRNIAPDTPTANIVIEPSNTPTANKFTKLSTKTNREEERNQRDHEAPQTPRAILKKTFYCTNREPRKQKNEALEHLQ